MARSTVIREQGQWSTAKAGGAQVRTHSHLLLFLYRIEHNIAILFMPTSTKKSRRRGRPLSYDRDVALGAIRDVFWDQGFSATSLDDIATAAGMNRPSLYRAFGHKREMYLTALRMFAAESGRELQQALEKPSLREALEAFYARAIQDYVSDNETPRGCLVICTAVSEATGDPEIRSTLAAILAEIDSMMAIRIAKAQAEGDHCTDDDAGVLARIATSVLHSLAVRARAGARRSELFTIARATAELIAGGASRVEMQRQCPVS
ncbi:TetR/AcrR family transcriptional regulator [Salinisphaera sp. RV14]|uniref:TetR/AcrR family transcriptional regulator n=1 Tax=Salinisphaera sp. RV14 TaxID=3454140 RepID=UPI003F87E0C9